MKNIKDAVKFNPRIIALSILSVIAGFVIVSLITGVFDLGLAQSVEICGALQNGNSSALQNIAQKFITLLIAAGFIGGVGYASYDTLKDIKEGGSSSGFFSHDALKAAIMLPISLLIIEFLISYVFNASISCILPW